MSGQRLTGTDYCQRVKYTLKSIGVPPIKRPWAWFDQFEVLLNKGLKKATSIAKSKKVIPQNMESKKIPDLANLRLVGREPPPPSLPQPLPWLSQEHL